MTAFIKKRSRDQRRGLKNVKTSDNWYFRAWPLALALIFASTQATLKSGILWSTKGDQSKSTGLVTFPSLAYRPTGSFAMIYTPIKCEDSTVKLLIKSPLSLSAITPTLKFSNPLTYKQPNISYLFDKPDLVLLQQIVCQLKTRFFRLIVGHILIGITISITKKSSLVLPIDEIKRSQSNKAGAGDFPK